MNIPEWFEPCEGEEAALTLLVDQFGIEMKDKLLDRQAAGWSGWSDPEYKKVLEEKLLDHVKKAKTKIDYVDVANFAAFLWHLAPTERVEGV